MVDVYDNWKLVGVDMMTLACPDGQLYIEAPSVPPARNDPFTVGVEDHSIYADSSNLGKPSP